MPNGVQNHAGILNDDDRLTDRAIQMFVDEVNDEHVFGSGSPSAQFPCGAKLDPSPYSEDVNLRNREEYEEFYSKYVARYEEIANSLNVKGNFSLLPICCPVSLGFKLTDKNLNLKFPDDYIVFMSPALPALAVMLADLDASFIDPIKLAAKFPDLFGTPQPPKVKVPPEIDIPTEIDLFNYQLTFSTKLPNFFANLIAKMPQFAPKVPTVKELLGDICGVAQDAKLFGDIDPAAKLQLAATKVLTRKTTEMIGIAMIGSTLGSSPQGITGATGAALGYKSPEQGDVGPSPVRQKIVNWALGAAGLGYGNDSTQYINKLYYADVAQAFSNPSANLNVEESLTKVYAPLLGRASKQSSCGIFVRSCYYAGGARQQVKYGYKQFDFFLDPYVDGTAIEGLLSIARDRSALKFDLKRDGVCKTLPALQPGDGILIGGGPFTGEDPHFMLVTNDHPGGTVADISKSRPIQGVEGGLPDSGNASRSTFVGTNRYDKAENGQYGLKIGKSSPPESGFVTSNPRTVIAVIDAELMCTKNDRSGMVVNISPGSGIDSSEQQ